MIAVDTNILVYAHRLDSKWHEQAVRLLSTLVSGASGWGLPWPCVHEFLATVTNARLFAVPTPIDRAFDQIGAWMDSPTCRLLTESAGHLEQLRAISLAAKLSGGQFHDARIAAICLQNGVTENWTADRDFQRFPKLRARNPLIN